MNNVDEKLIAIWWAAVMFAPRVPTRMEIALKSPASAVTMIAIGRPSTTISRNIPRRGGASFVKIPSGR